jgi:hypothetical protein
MNSQTFTPNPKVKRQITREGMTPNAIEVLLHYYAHGAPHPRHSAPAVVQAKKELLSLKAIKPVIFKNSRPVDVAVSTMESDHKEFITTELGKTWVENLCQTIRL